VSRHAYPDGVGERLLRHSINMIETNPTEPGQNCQIRPKPSRTPQHDKDTAPILE
jgi:hypothetical protein